jgi:hypothetical protein
MSTPSLLNIPYRLKAGTLYSQLPETGAGDFTVSRTTTVANRSTRINSLGNIEIVNDNVPRLDYPVGGAVNGCPALLVEPAATNSIRNNSMVNAVAGTPGTFPTNWAESLSGLVRQSVALGTENGVSYIDIRYSGTASGSSAAVLFETATQIVASTGQDWSNSVYLKIIAQPNPPIAYRLSMWEYNTSGTVFGGSFATAVVPTTTSLQRFTQTRALTGATTDRIRPLFDVSMTSGQTYDFTIRIGYPQMERGTVATSVIPTTTASVTRSEDQITRPGVSSLIGQTEGTFYFEGEANFAATDLPSLNRSIINSILLAKNASNQVVAYVYYGGVFLPIFATASAITGPFKAALAYRQGSPGDTAFFVNGVQAGSTNAATWAFTAGLNDVIVRADSYIAGGKPYKVRALGVYPNRIPNTAGTGVLSLQSLTT